MRGLHKSYSVYEGCTIISQGQRSNYRVQEEVITAGRLQSTEQSRPQPIHVHVDSSTVHSKKCYNNNIAIVI